MIKYIIFLLLLTTNLPVEALSCNEGKLSINPKSGSVIFVHGFMRSSKNMSALVYSFKKDEWKVENWSYPSRQKNIEEHADDLIDKIKLISQKRPGKPISFVTHSMGGLIVRCALNNPDCPYEAKIGRAVLIAPPNRGSIFARKLFNCQPIRNILGKKSGKQLMTLSPEDFDSLGSFPDSMPILIISGKAGLNPLIPDVNDGKVGFKETCLKTPHFHETSNACHSWICYTPNVIKKTKNFLSSPQIF